MQVHWEQLLFFLRRALNLSEVEAPRLPEPTDWEALLALAGRQRVLALLHEGLLKSELPLPENITNRLQAYRLQLSMHNLKQTRELLRLIDLLRKKGVEVTPYKGPILAEIGFGDLNQRFFSDLDFLIDKKDLPIVSELMESLGYEHELQLPQWGRPLYFWHKCEYNFDYYEAEERIFHVEPHWSVGVPRFQVNASYRDIAPLCQRQAFHGVLINQLSVEGLLLTTIMHHSARDRWSYLKQPLDVVAVLVRHRSNIDWDLLLREAERLGILHLVLFSFALVEEIFAFPFPEKIRRLIQRPRFQRLVPPVLADLFAESFIRDPKRSDFFKVLFFHLRLRKSGWVKARILFFHLLRMVIPDLSRRYALRPHQKKTRDFLSLFGQ